ncbi:MAG: hypothetical protein A2452_03610 [Candidatus Firestonebacteria bacterium RIFOXYC2_FULL_39_67]|nr:MAG: hypothetical protein A2536_00435 [Candidatus Firestonebacteria bacterium RIFOXYD2_FULL_39_29]OGF51938.1 MAG: hypothetical protein A2497_07650 [Candidatus Firestonebacteria bacterium RifOxyC12_full_39_7]OGF57090.1 MAG: hypothetical protein A2452_03610 [Candidatus Firestonebacteria bacterium RIFOXYC2_FULL_39_67]
MMERSKRVKLFFCSLRSRLLSNCQASAKEESGFIRNISEKGMCISTVFSLSKDDVISTYFRLPSVDHTFFFKAKVAWVKNDEVGLRFQDINEEDRNRIREYIESYNNTNMFKYYQQLQDLFAYCEADTEEKKKEVYRLRYLIYTKEHTWEPPNETGLEIDEYDAKSTIFMVKDRNDVTIASTRLIPADKYKLPLETHFDVDVLRNGKYKRENVMEISRFCIAREYRRRVDDLQYKENNTEAKFSTEKELKDNFAGARSPNLLIGLWRILYQYAIIQKKQYSYLVTESRLANSLINAGLNLEKIGEPRNYHGMRTPYFINLAETGKVLEAVNPVLLQWFNSGMKLKE